MPAGGTGAGMPICVGLRDVAMEKVNSTRANLYGATRVHVISRSAMPSVLHVRPAKILGVGLNYRAHAAEMKKALPDEPLLFMKPSTAIIGPGEAIVRPRGWNRMDFEGELAFVVGKRCRRVARANALDVVAGWTIVNDVSVRDLQVKDVQYTRAKGFDTFCPCGPVVVPAGQLDPGNLRIVTRVNGQVRQDSTTADMIFDIATIIEVASRCMTLEEGDLITTGTPSGVGPLVAGDVVAIEIEGIGVLENPVVDEPEQA
jgi:2-keto-4-pentenoate hydratase/2-oxohepta-3-ene-1,7-dioic acid hydratase in catechol pathway